MSLSAMTMSGWRATCRHIDEVGDLAVAAMHGAIDHQLKIKPRIPPHQRFHHRNCAVVGILDAENDLDMHPRNPDSNRFRCSRRVAPRRRTAASGSRHPAMLSEQPRLAVGRTTAPLPRRRPRTGNQKQLRSCKLGTATSRTPGSHSEGHTRHSVLASKGSGIDVVSPFAPQWAIVCNADFKDRPGFERGAD